MSSIWALSDVLKYFQEDSEVRDVLTDAEFENLVNPDPEFLSTLKNALEYQGFDPRVVMRQIVRNRQSYETLRKPIMEWDLSNVHDDFRIRPDTTEANRFTNIESLSRDLNFLIMMFLLRNNHISKIIQKSIQGLSSILEMLKEKYDINDEIRRSGTALGSKDVTLPRMAGVLPSVAVYMFHQRAVKEIVPYSTIPGVTDSTDVDTDASTSAAGVQTDSHMTHAICCPFLPSLHPKIKPGQKHLHALMLYVAIRLDDIIHKKEKNFTPLSDLMTYYKAGYESPATPEKSRVEVCKKIGLITRVGNDFHSESLRITQQCYQVLKGMRTEDPHHAVMLETARTGVLPE
uniref:Uncharacterized protein n=1 Tax=Pararge aegeria TaxID=116150 RepID=S4PH54_9NEOP